MQARYYDPVIGRFYSNDPVDAMGHIARGNPVHGFNRFAYANNNPYKYIDPTGMAGNCLFCRTDYNTQSLASNGTPKRQTVDGKMAEQSGANNISEFNDTTTGEVVTEIGSKLPGGGGVVASVVGTVIQSVEGADVTSTASGVINGTVAGTITEDVLTDGGKNASNVKTKIISTAVGAVVGMVSSANEKNNATNRAEQKLEKKEED